MVMLSSCLIFLIKKTSWKSNLLWKSGISALIKKPCNFKIKEVSQIWNFFKIIWFLHNLKALKEKISEWVYFFNLTKRLPRDIQIFIPVAIVFRKWGYFKIGLRENLHIWNGTKKNADGLFCLSGNNNLKINACFVQNLMELEMKKFLDLKAVTFGVWGLKLPSSGAALNNFQCFF